jgi:3-hydroxyisobutyrate dehydrogenase-like beta-hydroxyacid dehydrogenase
MPADSPRVGTLGCVNMGSAIAPLLADAGHRVSAWNRTASRANALIGLGVDVAPAVQAWTEEADVALAVVSSNSDIRSALSGVEFTPGTVLVNLVTGTPSDAAGGSLLIAGPRSTWADCRPPIESLGGKSRDVSNDVRGANVLDVGVVGGYYTSTLVALIEAAAAARDSGVASEVLFEVVDHLGSVAAQAKAEMKPATLSGDFKITSATLGVYRDGAETFLRALHASGRRPRDCGRRPVRSRRTRASRPRDPRRDASQTQHQTRRPEGSSGRETTTLNEGDH